LILALRRPRHPIGWLFLAAGAFFALGLTSHAYAWRALVDAPGTLPGGELALLLSKFPGPLSLAALSVATLVFPTGRPPSRRWVAVLVAALPLIAARTIAQALASTPIPLPYALSGPAPDRLDLLPTIPNPTAIGGPIGEGLAALIPIIDLAAAPVVLACGLGLVVRFVRSSGIERVQLKWFVYATSLWIAFVTVAGTLHSGTLAGIAWVISVVFEGLIAVSVGIAILRYRLYDIDLLINRTLVYGALTATLAAAYVGAIGLFHVALQSFTEQSQLAVAASTLLVAALFQPLRARIQRVVDRRFYRSKYDAAKTLETFGARLRSQVDLETLRAEVVAAARETVQPRQASLWLREVGR
jgi:hypothetical protein